MNFEGETGPYLQYSLVREGNIRRRLEEAGRPSEVNTEQVAALSSELWQDDLWDMVLAVAQIPATLESAARTLELSLLARQALDLARKFHSIYHRHPILHEEDESLRTVRLADPDVVVLTTEDPFHQDDGATAVLRQGGPDDNGAVIGEYRMPFSVTLRRVPTPAL